MILNIIRNIRRFSLLRYREPLTTSSLRKLLGFYPVEYKYYKAAFTHNSCTYISRDGRVINNERLEFLGDSVLSTAVSTYLYKVYPDWDEGKMSKRRGVIVKRSVNNIVAEHLNLGYYLQRRDDINPTKDILGNTLEALIGAIYMDRGYDKAQEFIFDRIIPIFKEVEIYIENLTKNYKSSLVEWSQKYHCQVEFRMVKEPQKHSGDFVCEIWIGDKYFGRGKGSTKKEAHQEASRYALIRLSKSYKELKSVL